MLDIRIYCFAYVSRSTLCTTISCAVGVQMCRLLERCLREARCIDLESLCIIAEQQVTLSVEIFWESVNSVAKFT